MPHLALPTRETRAAILTTAGWVQGTFLIPTMRNIVDFANQHAEYFKLVDVRLPGIDQTQAVPFFALQRQSVILIMPDESEETLRLTTLGGDRIERDVSCTFVNGMASGALFVPQHARVSDFLMQRQAFFHLRDCSLLVREGSAETVKENVPMLVVNGTRIVGVSEPRIR